MRHRLIIIVFLLLAGCLIYIPPELGGALALTPDSSEYSICLANLFEHGRFGFTLNGVWYPSRYSPWFSLFNLLPAYLLTGNLLCCTWSMLLFSLALLCCMVKLGRITGLNWLLSIVSAAVLLFSPDFVFYSRIVATEIPYTAWSLAIGLLFVRFCSAEVKSRKQCLMIGAVIAWCATTRMTGAFLVAPFALALVVHEYRRDEDKCFLNVAKLACIRIFLVCLPIAFLCLANLVYNYFIFGEIGRCGYNYWEPIPYDSTAMVFSISNLKLMCSYLLSEPMAQCGLVCGAVVVAYVFFCFKGWLGGFAENRNLLLVIIFWLWHVVVLTALYAGYYFRDIRFFLPVIIPIPVLTVSVVVAMLKRLRWGLWPYAAVCCISIVGICLHSTSLMVKNVYLQLFSGVRDCLVECEVCKASIPDNAVVFPVRRPAVMDHYAFRDKHIIAQACKREVEYVGRMIARKELPCELPDDVAIGGISKKLISAGRCELVYPEVLRERPEMLKECLDSHHRAFLLSASKADHEYLDECMRKFGLATVVRGVYEIPAIGQSWLKTKYDECLFSNEYAMGARTATTIPVVEIVPAAARLD